MPKEKHRQTRKKAPLPQDKNDNEKDDNWGNAATRHANSSIQELSERTGFTLGLTLQFLMRMPLTQREAQTIYIHCYLPIISDPLPSTFIPPDKIYDTPKKVMQLFLLNMGFLRHLPWSIVYASQPIQGLGFRHLEYEQQMLQLLRHLRANTKNRKLYSIAINSYQLFSSLEQPILENTTSAKWCPQAG